MSVIRNGNQPKVNKTPAYYPLMTVNVQSNEKSREFSLASEEVDTKNCSTGGQL